MEGQQQVNLSEWRGQTLVDRDGEKIGKLEDVYIDTETDRPQFGSIKEGLISKHLTFVPLVDVTVGRDELRVPFTRERVKEAPNVPIDGDMDAATERALYEHFGMAYVAAPNASGRRLGRR